jgi:hypothetical protein
MGKKGPRVNIQYMERKASGSTSSPDRESPQGQHPVQVEEVLRVNIQYT